MNIFAEYPHIISSFIIPMIVAIFAFAFPLLIQTASRIDDKYHSTLLVKVFRKDWICKSYLWVLVFSIIALFIWILQLPLIFDCGVFNKLIENSALFFISITTFSLVVMTFGIVWLIYIYYVPDKLLDRLIKQYKATKDKSQYFVAISNIMHYAIRNADRTLSFKTLDFYSSQFVEYRTNKEDEVVVYPDEYYLVIEESNELVYLSQKIETSYFNESVLLGMFIDEYQKTIISQRTYLSIWKGLRQALYFNREEFVMAYWRKAHQYFNFFLKRIYPVYDSGWKNVINKDEIAKRDEERERFLEFHYALGGLLMFLGKYDLIRQITSWTNQQPPKYVLVPETMIEVINRYMNVSQKRGYFNPVYYEQNYPFPDTNGVNADGIIQMWIKRYISILFLRQYILNEHFIYSRTLQMPSPPETLIEKKAWNDELDSLKYFVRENLMNENLLQQLDLEVLSSEDWFKENEKVEPLALIDNLRAVIDMSIEQKKIQQEIDEEKKQEFYTATKAIISESYTRFGKLFGSVINENYSSFFLGGRFQVMNKEAFAKDQAVSYINSNTIVAETVSLELQRDILNVFLMLNRKEYLLEESETFSGIDNLITAKDEFVIVAVGVNLIYLQGKNNKLKNDNDNWSYNGISIINIDNSMNEFISQSFILIKIEDLPCLVHNTVSEERRVKYKLEHIDTAINTYASLINLNNAENEDITKEVSQGTGIHNLSKSVLVCVEINAEVRYREDAKCIQMKMITPFDETSTSVKAIDIENIWIIQDKK
jgi:hypothetical protein